MGPVGKAVRKTTDDVVAEFSLFTTAGTLIRAIPNIDRTGTITIKDDATTVCLWGAEANIAGIPAEIGIRFTTNCKITYSATTDDITWVYEASGG